MTGFRAAMSALLLLGVLAVTAAGTYAAQSDDDGSGDRRIAVRDDCDPNGGWEVVPGGCTREQGTVSRAEFDSELHSPLSTAVVGHQSWRLDPSYLAVKDGKNVRVTNMGGRPHTFTEVAAFGGGKGPPAFNVGLTTAPECPGSINMAPGETATVSGLAVGSHRFMCCIHPWMRAVIEVTPHGES
jgi:plastocyanin